MDGHAVVHVLGGADNAKGVEEHTAARKKGKRKSVSFFSATLPRDGRTWRRRSAKRSTRWRRRFRGTKGCRRCFQPSSSPSPSV
jgi:hypothetical protein